MSFTRITLIVFSLVMSTVICVGQRPPLKYGKVEEHEIALTSFRGADAVILCDYGEYKFNAVTGVVFFEYTRHLRIKILTEDGLRYATQQVHFYDLHSASYSPYNLEYTLRAQTLNVNEKGKIVASKVKTRFTSATEPNEDFNTTLTINFPYAKPGSIIEYEITVPTLETVNPAPWMVQYDIPSIWSELRIITPQEFNYAIKSYNIDYSDVYAFENIATSIQFPGKSVVYNGNQFQFIRKDIPSLPYMRNDIDYNNSRMYIKFILDYATKNFLFQGMNEIFKATDPEYKYMEKSEKQLSLDHKGYILYKRQDLQKISTNLNKSERFGVPLVLNMGMNDTVWKLIRQFDNDEDKVMAIYDFVRSQVKWDYRYRIFVNEGVPLFIVKLADKFSQEPVKMNTSLKKVMQKREGTNSEINAVLINLLRAAGFKANPVLTSTLKNGYLDTTFFNLHQFNHLIASVVVDGEEILLDAVEKGDGSIMSSEIMNEYGLMIEAKKARWIQVAYPYPILPRNVVNPNPDKPEPK